MDCDTFLLATRRSLLLELKITMKSQVFPFSSIAPVAVALSFALVSTAHAQSAVSSPANQQMIASSQVGASSSTPIALLQSQEPVIDPKEFSTQPQLVESKGWESAAESSQPSEIRNGVTSSNAGNVSTSETATSSASETSSVPTSETPASEKNDSAPVAEISTGTDSASVATTSAGSDAVTKASSNVDASAAKTEKTTVAENPVLERISLPVSAVASPATAGDASSVFSTEKTNVVEGLTALTPVEVKEEQKPVSTAKPETAAPDSDKRTIASTGDTQEPEVKLRGEATAPNAASSDSGTVGDTSSLRPIDIAQSSPNDATTSPSPDNREFDLTPVSLPRRTPSFNRFDGMHGNMLYSLPGRLFFSAVVDNSLRCETNVFQTKNSHRTDMVYRVLPNTVLGWALTRKTRVSANYFFLRDQYTRYTLLDRNFHSVGGQVDHDFYANNGLTVTGGFLARALFANPDEFNDAFFNDLLPSITATKQVGAHNVVYGSVVGQIRFREVLSQFQEGDQFYSVGTVYKNGPWQALGDFTLNNNFGNSNLRQGHNNQVIILTEEIARRLPYLRKWPIDAYIRAQQIFNMGANSSPGYAGFNSRIFGGIRAYVSKPPVYPVKLAGK